MADHGVTRGSGEVVDRPEDEGRPMVAETEDRPPMGVVIDASAEVAGGGDGEQGHEQEAGGEGNHRATVSERRATEEAGAVTAGVVQLDPSEAVSGSVVVGGGSEGTGSGSAEGGGDEPSETPPRDPAKGIVMSSVIGGGELGNGDKEVVVAGSRGDNRGKEMDYGGDAWGGDGGTGRGVKTVEVTGWYGRLEVGRREVVMAGGVAERWRIMVGLPRKRWR
ncbi:uncharacterized protein LOC131323792 [Rhododendron vialii]|uniref:uncharacterized protein LOC131323792 n=1 Tax=Rhododendron vialii TaxID=182163 RepID=UPI002660372B|nr:uncharacterized protein LOC131323792 [Rhododendron vialii]